MRPIEIDVQSGEVVFDEHTGKLVAILWKALHQNPGQPDCRVKFLGNNSRGVWTNLFETREECLAWVCKELEFERKGL